MKKTLEEILSEPVNIEDLIRTKKVIDKLIEKSKEAGIEWPETGKTIYSEGTRLIVKSEYDDLHHYLLPGSIMVVDKYEDGFYYTTRVSGVPKSFGMARWVHESVVEPADETEVSSFNDVE